MEALELISDTIPALKTSDTGESALNIMELYRVSHLPIINTNRLLGILSDEDIYNLSQPTEPVGNHKLSIENVFALPNTHIYEVISLFSVYDLTVLPVVDAEGEFMGSITLRDLVRKFSDLLATGGPGGVILLEFRDLSFSMAEIARIIEEDNAKILSSYLNHCAVNNVFKLTIKVNREDLTSVLKSFERYNYNVKSWYMNEGKLDSIIQERYDALMRFLDT
jgi:acetoin utilization protein AcuB